LRPAAAIGALETSVNGKKLLTLAVGVFLIFFVVNSPSDAANVVKSAQHVVGHGFNSISQFIKSF
jgi:hypothetical protein